MRVISQDYPTVIFITMIRRVQTFYEGSRMADLCRLRVKFNEILNESASRQKYNILSIKSCATIKHFDCMDNLSAKGMCNFWEELDDLLDQFDANKVKLLLETKNNQFRRQHTWRQDQIQHQQQQNYHSDGNHRPYRDNYF